MSDGIACTIEEACQQSIVLGFMNSCGTKIMFASCQAMRPMIDICQGWLMVFGNEFIYPSRNKVFYTLEQLMRDEKFGGYPL